MSNATKEKIASFLREKQVAETAFLAELVKVPSDNPPGDWMMVKIFLPKGSDDEGELFLNLNPLLSKGEFSIKDSDYGDYLLKQFAKVL